jgi:hypothetical protein
VFGEGSAGHGVWVKSNSQSRLPGYGRILGQFALLGRTPVVRLLVERGADLHDCVFDDEGPAPLDCAVWRLRNNRAADADHPGTVEALLAAGAPTRHSGPTGDKGDRRAAGHVHGQQLTTPRQPRGPPYRPRIGPGRKLAVVPRFGSLPVPGKGGDGQGVRSSSARSRTGSMPYARSSAPAGSTVPMVQPSWARCLRPRRPSGAPYGSSRSRSTP